MLFLIVVLEQEFKKIALYLMASGKKEKPFSTT